MPCPEEQEPMNHRIVRVPVDGQPIITCLTDRVFVPSEKIDPKLNMVALTYGTYQDGLSVIETVEARVVRRPRSAVCVGATAICGSLAI